MGSVINSMLTLAGYGLIIFALISMVTGKITYSDRNRNRSIIDRTQEPSRFWLISMGLLAGGVVLLVVSAVPRSGG